MWGDANGSRSLGYRIAVTVGMPLGLRLADRIPAPGINPELRASLDTSSLGVMALGIGPALSAYLTVEIAALVIPRFRPMRHGGPKARQKLARAASVVTVVLAVMQAFAMAMYLAGIELELPDLLVGPMARWSFAASVCAGACVTLLAARWVSRQGLANGFVLIWLLETADVLLGSLLHETGTAALLRLNVREIAIATTAGLLLPAAATWLALSTPLVSSHGRPLVPVPASSMQPFSIGVAALGIPTTVANFFPETALLAARWTALPARLWLMSATTLAAAVALASLFQRPRTVASVLTRAGAPLVEPEDVTQAARRALLPTLLFLGALVLCTAALERLPKQLPLQASVLLTFLVFLGAVIGDFSRSLQGQRRHADLVPVWEERRPYLLPYLRKLFAEHGIPIVTLHECQQNLLRFFAPYVAAEIWVPAEARVRARKLLKRHLLQPVKAAAAAPRETTSSARAEPAQHEGMQVPLLAGVTIAALGLAIVAPLRSGASPPTARLEITRIDDSVDPFATGAELPEGASIESESVGMGVEASSVRFLQVTPRSGESSDAALTRVRPWIRRLKLPPRTRLVFGKLDSVADDTANTGAQRSYLLAGDPVITTSDVTEAKAGEDAKSAFVTVTISAEAARRLAQVTREQLHKRLAIVLEGKVELAPIVTDEITGGVLTITMGAEDAAGLERAETIARGLRP